jgi:hypothetical protein
VDALGLVGQLLDKWASEDLEAQQRLVTSDCASILVNGWQPGSRRRSTATA